MARHPVPIQLVDVFGSALENGAITVVEHGTDEPVILHDANIGGSVITQPAMTNRYGELEVWTDFVGLIDVIYEETDETTDARDRRRRFDTQTKTWEVGLASGAGFEQLQADSQTPYLIQFNTDEPLIYSNNARYINVNPHSVPNEPLRAVTPLGSLIDPYVLPPLGTGDHDQWTAHFRFARAGTYRVVQTYTFYPGAFDWSKLYPTSASFWTIGDPPADGFSAWGANVARPLDASGPKHTPFSGTKWVVELRATHAVVDLDPEDIPSYYPGSYPYGLAMSDYVVPVGWDYYCAASLTSDINQFALGTVPTIDSLDVHILRIA